jgi:hypothetical protein
MLFSNKDEGWGGGGVKENIDSTGEEAVWLGSDPKMTPFLLVSVRVFMKSLFGMAPTTRGTAMLTAD